MNGEHVSSNNRLATVAMASKMSYIKLTLFVTCRRTSCVGTHDIGLDTDMIRGAVQRWCVRVAEVMNNRNRSSSWFPNVVTSINVP